jgi:hypothetical protein
MLYSMRYSGMSYSGSTHAWGACSPGSIPGIPTQKWLYAKQIVRINIKTEKK